MTITHTHAPPSAGPLGGAPARTTGAVVPSSARRHGRTARPGAHRGRARQWLAGRACTARSTVLARRDDGMATAEYAIATIAAVGFAGLLIAVLKSATVKSLLSGLISTALSIG
ncbi:DUF4244 domain-containing protein [Sanguibacter sp. 25GB23B1]|uniref:DUF4244 domain-containing protein n=1 Tax=unclassified Sanguibacter TaxID=2645534 RepID=UPI0032AF8CC0